MIKQRFISVTLILFIAGIWFACKPQQVQRTQQTEKPYLVVLSIDGFRWDYTEKANTPNFDKLARKGVKAKSMIPSFPTKTFPNHYTLATSLHPDHHGFLKCFL